MRVWAHEMFTHTIVTVTLLRVFNIYDDVLIKHDIKSHSGFHSRDLLSRRYTFTVRYAHVPFALTRDDGNLFINFWFFRGGGIGFYITVFSRAFLVFKHA